MSLWPPGVVQRVSSQTPPQHVIQYPRATLPGWQSTSQQFHHPLHQQQQQQQQQQLCLLLEQSEQQEHIQHPQLYYSTHTDALQYVLRQQASPLRQSVSPARGLGAVAAAVVAARPDQSTSSVSQAADSTVQWPAATFDRLTDVVCVPHEVVQWPQDKQPKLGYITKNKLRKLTAPWLRTELARLQAPSSKGLKEDLINLLLAHLVHPHTTAGAAGPVTFTELGLQLLQRLAPAAAGSGSSVSLQALTHCQVHDLQAALQAAWPLVSPAVSISQEQLLSGTADDLVHKLVLCIATAVSMDQQQLEQQLSTQQEAVPVAVPLKQQQQQPQVAGVTLEASAHGLQQQPQQQQDQQDQQPQEPVQEQQQTSTATLQQPPPSQQQQQQLQRQSAADIPAGYVLSQGPVVVPGSIGPYDPVQAAAVAAAVGVSLDELPPLAPQTRGHVYDCDWHTSFTAQEKEMVLKANRAGLTLTLVGGAVDGGVSGDSTSACLSLLRERDAWLFDVGEDTQRQLMWTEHVRPSKLHRVVVTRQSPDALLGLPGALCVIGSSREKGHEKADIPIHVFGPEGTCAFLATMYDVGNTFLEMPVVVHEFVHHAVSEEERTPQLFSDRSKLWRVLLPPDQLNPDGYMDARLDYFSPLEGRARMKSGSRSAGGVLAKNPRAGYRPLPTPPPGDPSLTGLARADMIWTIQADEAAMLTAVPVEAEDLAWAMVWREADKQGNISVPRCKALNINDGELYGVLKAGESVPNDDGVIIPASMVCRQDKPGRKLVLLPGCTSAAALGQHAADADVMFASAAAAQDAAPGGPLGASIGRCAREWGVRVLVPTGMPQSPEVTRAHNLENNAFNPAWRARRKTTLNAGSGPISASGSDDESDHQQQQQQQEAGSSEASEQQPWEQQLQQELHPEDLPQAAFLQAVLHEFDCGLVLPGRDGLSVLVEENSGRDPPPPLDMIAKEEVARTSVLLMCADALKQPQQQQRGQQQRQYQGRDQGRGGGRGGRPQQRPYQQRQGGQQYRQQQQQRSYAQ